MVLRLSTSLQIDFERCIFQSKNLQYTRQILQPCRLIVMNQNNYRIIGIFRSLFRLHAHPCTTGQTTPDIWSIAAIFSLPLELFSHGDSIQLHACAPIQFRSLWEGKRRFCTPTQARFPLHIFLTLRVLNLVDVMCGIVAIGDEVSPRCAQTRPARYTDTSNFASFQHFDLSRWWVPVMPQVIATSCTTYSCVVV